MTSRRQQSAGGVLLAASVVTGTVVGVLNGQPSIGFLSGLGVGIVVAVVAAFLGRRGAS